MRSIRYPFKLKSTVLWKQRPWHNITIILNINMNITTSSFSHFHGYLTSRRERNESVAFYILLIAGSNGKSIFMELFVWKNVNRFPVSTSDQDFFHQVFLRTKETIFTIIFLSTEALYERLSWGSKTRIKSLHAFPGDNYKPFVCARAGG